MTDPHAASAAAPSDAAGTQGPGVPTSTAQIPPAVGAAAAQAAAAAAAELPGRAADAVQLLVDTIHDKAVRPAVLGARAVVFGLLIAAMAALLAVMGAVGVVRLLDVYAFGHRVWLSYIVVGGLLTFAGFGVWTRRNPRPSPVPPR